MYKVKVKNLKVRNPYVSPMRQRLSGAMDSSNKSLYNRDDNKSEVNDQLVVDNESMLSRELALDTFIEIEDWGRGLDEIELLKNKAFELKISGYLLLLKKELQDGYYQSDDLNVKKQVAQLNDWVQTLESFI